MSNPRDVNFTDVLTHFDFRPLFQMSESIFIPIPSCHLWKVLSEWDCSKQVSFGYSLCQHQVIGKNTKLYQMQKRPTQCPAYWWKFKKYKMLFSDCSGSHLLKGHKLPQNKQLIQCSLSSVSTTHHEMPQSTHMIKICPIWSKETVFLSRFFLSTS